MIFRNIHNDDSEEDANQGNQGNYGGSEVVQTVVEELIYLNIFYRYLNYEVDYSETFPKRVKVKAFCFADNL
jgi:hypothetical protein